MTALDTIKHTTPAEAAEAVKHVHPVQKLSRLKRLVPNAVSTRSARQILVLQKNAPNILFGVGVVGVVATTVTASIATLKLEGVLEDLQKDLADADRVRVEFPEKYSERDMLKDKAVIFTRTGVKLGKLYGPTFVLGSLSVAALTGSHNMLNRRNMALTAAYATIEKGFDEYRGRVREELGEDKDREFRYGSETRTVVEDTDKGPKKVQVKHVAPGTPSAHARFFDEFTRNWQRNGELNLLFIRCQQNYANDLLHSRGHLFLNEVYDMLGIERSQAGQVVGWVVGPDRQNTVDFGVYDGDNPKARDFVNGREGSILLDFNVDGVVYDKI